MVNQGRPSGLFLPRAPREFKQRRAAATYQALLDAAAQVFAKKGFDGAQTPDIAAHAGVSTGAFYRYFTDKRQVFVEVIADHLRRAHDDVMGRLAPSRFDGHGDGRAAIDRALGVLFDHFQRDAALDRVLMQMSLRDPEVERLRAEFEEIGLTTLTRLIEQIAPRKRVPNARAAAIVIQVAALEIAGERAGLRPRLGPSVKDAEVKAALGDMLYRYVLGDEPCSAPSADKTAATRGGKPSGKRKPRSSRRTG
jgi:AcrR family transcriptional regulator